MKKLKINYKRIQYIIFSLIFILVFSKNVYSNDILFTIKGNKFTDSDVIISLLTEIPKNTDEDYSNDIIKRLNDSNLFSNVEVKYNNNEYIIFVQEFLNINNIKFNNNDRLKDEDLETIIDEINFKTYNTISLNLFINQTKKIYESFGYNDVKISYSKKVNLENNTVDLLFDINEGKITKINRIIINDNNSFLDKDIRNIITSKTKSLTNIFANNNFKPLIVERDKFLILDFYKNNGYLDVEIDTKVEYLKNNKVNIYFKIKEGKIYQLSSIEINDKKNLLNKNILDLIQFKKDNFILTQNYFSPENTKQFREDLSDIIIQNGIEYFEIITSDKVEDTNIKIIFDIEKILPKYSNQINIVGNTRTFDYVIRREIEIDEGDSYNSTQLNKIREKLISLNLFESVNIKEEEIDKNLSNIIIEIQEKQTGSFNAGLSIGTLDGFALVTGLKERNFYGTGRSLDALINTSNNNNEFKVVTTDRLSYKNDADISYKLKYKQQDFSKSSSYNLDTFTTGVGIGYKINKNLFHNFDVEYVLKDYAITNSTTVSQSILDSSGGNMSFLVKNNFLYSSMNQGFISKNGNYFNFNNTFETPTSSANGYFRNIITLKKYYSLTNKNIFSAQSKIGNIISLNNNEILADDKFSLGGRWLRGFDNYGVGPRNSRNAYIGGNNIIATKFDYAYEITNNSNFPIYLNFFNDYGLIWENKTKPTNSDNSLRSSAGFGFKYYSPIGPIGFTWGFPIQDEDYDIKRMFLFSVGNLDWS